MVSKISQVHQSAALIVALEFKYDRASHDLMSHEREIEAVQKLIDETFVDVDHRVSSSFRASGMEALWLGWSMRQREKLLLQLARLKAEEDSLRKRVRRTLGELTAMRKLSERMKARAANERQKSAQERLLEYELYRR